MTNEQGQKVKGAKQVRRSRNQQQECYN